MSETDRWFVNPASATEGNLVTPLIDGVTMMAQIDEQLAQLQAGDFCFYGAWLLNRYMNLTSAPVSVGMRFETAIANGADVRILLFKGVPQFIDYVGTSQITHRTAHLDVVKTIGAAGGQVIIDLKHPTVGSHHDKYAIFGKQTAPGQYTLTAFCGGIDLHLDRRDDFTHITPMPNNMAGWHDVHSRIEGPAAAALWNDFVQRWNDQPSPDATDYKTATTVIDTSVYSFNPPVPTTLPHRVEVLNTYHCSHFQHTAVGPITGTPSTAEVVYYDFVGSDGIHTIRDGYLNAIQQAQHYIYIENLFFYEPEISEAIRDRLNQTDSLHVILITPSSSNTSLSDRHYLSQNLETVRQAPGAADRFHVCTLKHIPFPPDPTDGGDTGGSDDSGGDSGDTGDAGSGDDTENDASDVVTPIYIHAKMMIVDDLYFTVGSANLSPRSMTHDTEINVGVVGEDLIDYEHESVSYTVSQSVRDFRVALWSEHLQIDSSASNYFTLLEIPTAIDTWLENTDVPPSRVSANEPGWGIFSPLWASLLHPSQQCF